MTKNFLRFIKVNKMASRDLIYRQLQNVLDERLPVGFPATESGIEIRVLKHLFTPEEGEIAIFLTILPEPLEEIHKRVVQSGISINLYEVEEILDGLVKKGAIVGGSRLADKSGNHYSLMPFAIGFYETQLDKQTKEFASDAYEYLYEKFYQEFHRKDTPAQMRTIPVEKSLTPEHYVGTYDNIKEIIKNKSGTISVMDCVCRQSKDLMEEPCKLGDIRNCCISFDDSAKHLLEEFPSARKISKEELIELLDKFQKAGFVLQPVNVQNPSSICVCCGCCCGVLQAAKQYPRPAEYYSSNFYAQSDPELCNGCETCLKRCPMEAITMVDDKSIVDLDRCIGCGNCVPTCGMKAMSLQKKEEEIVPFENSDALYQEIMNKKMG